MAEHDTALLVFMYAMKIGCVLGAATVIILWDHIKAQALDTFDFIASVFAVGLGVAMAVPFISGVFYFLFFTRL